VSIILSELKRNNLITSIRGPKGGYKIARPIDNISIVDIMEAIGEKIKITRCNGRDESCNGSKIKCTAHNMWKKLEDNMSEYLSSMTLKDILNTGTDALKQCNHPLIRSI
jgi:Rrf2 family iron-sulfur cluster assembly transcriptional regulator